MEYEEDDSLPPIDGISLSKKDLTVVATTPASNTVASSPSASGNSPTVSTSQSAAPKSVQRPSAVARLKTFDDDAIPPLFSRKAGSPAPQQGDHPVSSTTKVKTTNPVIAKATEPSASAPPIVPFTSVLVPQTATPPAASPSKQIIVAPKTVPPVVAAVPDIPPVVFAKPLPLNRLHDVLAFVHSFSIRFFRTFPNLCRLSV